MFKEILKEAVKGLPGAVGAVFVDWEGESVDWFFPGSDYDIRLLGAHQGILLNLVNEAVRSAGQGSVRAMISCSTEAKVLVHPLKDGYFLVTLLERGANSGRAMQELRRTAKILAEEI